MVDVTGYILQYSTDRYFGSNVKTVNISKNKTTSKKITKLKSGTIYYVRMYAYKKVSGKKIQGYVNGDKKYEEVKSLAENVEMDRQHFVQDFFPDCKVSDINEVLDKTDYLFAEDRLFELGDVLGLELLEP